MLNAIERMSVSWPVVRRSAATIVVVALGAGAAIGWGPLKERVGAQQSDPLVVSIMWPALGDGSDGTWLPAGERGRLEQLVAATVSPNPFDHGSLEETRDRLEGTGWFSEGLVVRRMPRGLIEVEGRWRQPGAVVRFGGSDRLVSTDGRLLRLEYTAGDAGAMRAILNPSVAAPMRGDGSGDYGELWAGGDVQASLGLLDLLRPSLAWSSVGAIDAGGFVRTGRLTIVTTRGARLDWGAEPGASAAGEQPDEAKLANLVKLLADPVWNNAGRPPAKLYMRRIVIDKTFGGG